MAGRRAQRGGRGAGARGGEDHLDLRRLTFANPDPLMAEAFGAAPWPGPMTPVRRRSGPAARLGRRWLPQAALRAAPAGPARVRVVVELYAQQILATLAMAVDRGVYHRSDTALVEAIARRLARGEFDDGVPPARIHGLWSGNSWTREGAVLIDPAAHGGHRETDLAMLALFGCPHLEWVVSGYLDQHRLDAEWPQRVALHQLHPLMIHAVLFGGGYIRQSLEHARRYR